MEELHLPWNIEELKALIKKIIPLWETTKIDLKSAFDISSEQQKAELIKDVSAIANTFSTEYRNYWFIIFTNNSWSFSFPDTQDHLQAGIDTLIKTYIEPFIKTNLYIFESYWVLLIPPTKNAPHIFVKDIHKRYNGDVYIRTWTTTNKAKAQDYSRFFRQHFEEYVLPLQEKTDFLQSRITTLEKSKKNSSQIVYVSEKDDTNPKISEPTSLQDAISLLLPEKQENIIEKLLIDEVKKIQQFINSWEIPWLIQNIHQWTSKEIIEKLEDISLNFWTSLREIILRDEKWKYQDAILNAMSLLSKKIDTPSWVTFSDLGKWIRYYPLYVSLYIISITCYEKKRDSLLKKVYGLKLSDNYSYEEDLPIAYTTFLMHRAWDFFQWLHPNFPHSRWCDPIATHIKWLIDKFFQFEDVKKTNEVVFYCWEFILCLSPIDIIWEDWKPLIWHWWWGLFLYISSSVRIISKFLKEEKDWLSKVYNRPLKEILETFDKTAHTLTNWSGCFSDGFTEWAIKYAYPEDKK